MAQPRSCEGGYSLWEQNNNGWVSLSSSARVTPSGPRSSENWRSRPPLRPSSPLSLSHLDTHQKRRSPVKAQHCPPQSKPAWDSLNDHTGTAVRGLYSTHSSSGSEGGVDGWELPGLRRWRSLSRLAPEGAPRPTSPAGQELRTALVESGARRAELVRQLREAHSRLEQQAELLRGRDGQLDAHRAQTELLELKHKQLALALNTLEQEKEAAKLCRFEESRRCGELQDKVLQLEMNMLNMRTMLERGNLTSALTCIPMNSHVTPSLLSNTLPRTHEDFYKQGKDRAERELLEAREALRGCQERVETLEAEKDQVLQQLRASKEGQLAALSQTNETNQRLTSSVRAQSDLQDELSCLQSQFSQVSLEKELLSSKNLRLEQKLEDLKMTLSGALADKERFLQEKAELHQRVQGLELELERAKLGREGFTEQVSELHKELVGAKAQANRQDQEKVLMKEELFTVKQVNERVASELAEVKQRLDTALQQVHELEAEKVIHTNQISALEMERSQLIGEKELLMGTEVGHLGHQEELQELRETCQALRDSQQALRSENQELRSCCQEQGADLRVREAGLRQKEEEHEEQVKGLLSQVEELQRVAAHWKERWQEAAVALRSRELEVDLEEAQGQPQTPADTSQQKEEVAQLSQQLERLKTEVQNNQEEILRLMEQKSNAETELRSLKISFHPEGSKAPYILQERTCFIYNKLQVRSARETEGLSRSASPSGRVFAPPVGIEQQTCQEDRRMSRQDRGTITDSITLLQEELQPEVSVLQQQLEESSCKQRTQLDIIKCLREELQELKSNKSGDIKASLEEVDGELLQVRAELQKMWDVLKIRDSELEVQHQELQSARGQISERSNEVKRLEKMLEEQAQELAQKKHALGRLERLRETEKTELEIKVSSLELKFAELRELEEEQTHRSEKTSESKCLRCKAVEDLTAQLQEKERRCAELQQERDQAVQAPEKLQQGSGEKEVPRLKRKIHPQNSDHDRQRKLVLEQLKSLFREREQLGKTYVKLAEHRKAEGSLEEWGPKGPQLIQNALDTLSNQERSRRELEGERERLQEAPEYREHRGLQEQVDRLREELRSKTDKMSSMGKEIENLKERNENLLKAKLRFQQQIQGLRASGPQWRDKSLVQGVPWLSEDPIEGEHQGRSATSSPSRDGTFLARQVEVLDFPGEEPGEHETVRDTRPGSWSSSSPVPLNAGVLPRTPNELSVPTTPAKPFSSRCSPDLSPLTPRSWASSQESLADKPTLLLSPQPFRSQTLKNSLRSGEK
ncbi:golgin subfamily A member 6-like protein 22 isoform X2 [Lepisosteus oculatus]|uniref:golgin subfamily A member 6-like protein 22 isoform X2 n=1 Tax=Lepisosteus oculatus TaxID=7918 RepID=UPI00371A4283